MAAPAPDSLRRCAQPTVYNYILHIVYISYPGSIFDINYFIPTKASPYEFSKGDQAIYMIFKKFPTPLTKDVEKVKHSQIYYCYTGLGDPCKGLRGELNRVAGC